MKKIIKHLRKNWIRHGFETLVVINGILIAFALNNWNENRKLREIEFKLLREMATDLEVDLYTLDVNIALHESGAMACEIILKAIQEDQPYHDSLAAYFSMTHNYTVFSSLYGAYESLKSMGIGIIQNDDIRLEAINMYESKFPTHRANEVDFTQKVLEMEMNTNPTRFEEFYLFEPKRYNMEGGSYGGRMVPNNFSALKNDQIYKYHLKSLMRGHTMLLDWEKVLKRQIQVQISRINDEISSRGN